MRGDNLKRHDVGGSNHKAAGFKYKLLWLKSYYCSWSFDENSGKLLCPRSFISDPWLRQNRRHLDITRAHSWQAGWKWGGGGGQQHSKTALKLLTGGNKKKLIFGAFCLHNKSNTKHWYCIVHFRKIMKENLDQIWNFGFWVRPEEYERTSIRITGIGIEMWRITSRFSAQNRRPFDIHRSKIRTFLLAIQTGNIQAKYVVKGGAKRTHVFQIIVTLLIFNIKKLCQHQNNL